MDVGPHRHPEFCPLSNPPRQSHRDTRKHLLQASESLFIERGYEAMSLRQITTRARANLAAVNYHFGSKEALVQELLSQRLDRLNRERLALLSACEQQSPEGMDVAAILAVLFVPAFRLGRCTVPGPDFMRLLGRVYSDSSPFIRHYLQKHYQPISGRFFDAFSRALPALPRSELGLRLHFALKALSGMLAGEDMQELICNISKGQTIDDAQLLARLISLISPILTAPFGSPEQIHLIEHVLERDTAVAAAITAATASPEHVHPKHSPMPLWDKESALAS